MTTTYENWTDIPGYEGLYAVRVRDDFRQGEILAYAKQRRGINGGVIKYHEKIKKATIDKDGYARVNLCKNGKQYSAGIHRFVALTHIPNPENKPHVNHLLGDKLDNRPKMIEWSTQSENEKHAHSIGLKNAIKGDDNYLSFKITQLSINGDILKEWPSAGEIYRQLGFYKTNVLRAANGIWSQAYGFKWKFTI